MDVIKTLKDIQYMKMDIKYIEEKLHEKRINISSVKSDMSPGSNVSNTCKQITESLVTIEEIENELIEKRNKVLELEKQVEEKIKTLEPKERIILKLYYCEGETLEYICGVVNYSFRHVSRMHRKALSKLEKMS